MFRPGNTSFTWVTPLSPESGEASVVFVTLSYPFRSAPERNKLCVYQMKM